MTRITPQNQRCRSACRVNTVGNANAGQPHSTGGNGARRGPDGAVGPGDYPDGSRGGAPAAAGPIALVLARSVPHHDRPARHRPHRQEHGRLLGQAPVRARGPRRRPQAPGHVHRVDRRPRPHALPVGDHRQLRRRGARRALPPHRRRAPRRRLGRGPRRRSRHPGRRRAQDEAHRRRGRHDPAARRRQVRRRLLHRVGRPARRRRVGGQRAVRAARRRGRPRRQDPHDVVPARRARASSTARGPTRRSRKKSGLRRRREGPRRASPAPAPGTGPTGRSSSRTPSSTSRSCTPAPGRPRSSSPASRFDDPRRARRGGHRSRRSSTRAASPSTRVPRARTRRSPTSLRLKGSGHFKETVPVLDGKGHMVSQEVERELGVDVALRWGTGYDTDVRSLRQHHRDAQGRHPRAGLRARAGEDASTSSCARTKVLKASEDDVLKDDIARGPHRDRHRAAVRAAVRGPDQGGPRYAGGDPHRRQRRVARSSPPGSRARRAATSWS